MAKPHRYAVCVEHGDNPASLEVRKIYRVIEDSKANAHGLIRVIDESEEDYLYPAEFFVPIEIPRAVEKAFSQKSA